MSDRLHDRFLERPAFFDLDFIRAEIKKLEAQIESLVANHLQWDVIVDKLGDPVEYADAVFASRLLSPEVSDRARKSSVVVIVLKILFVVAPVNFIVAIGPLLLAIIVAALGWVTSLVVTGLPLVIIVHGSGSLGLSENLLLIALSMIGLMMVLLMTSLTRVAIRAIWTWLGWNIAFLRAESLR